MDYVLDATCFTVRSLELSVCSLVDKCTKAVRRLMLKLRLRLRLRLSAAIHRGLELGDFVRGSWRKLGGS
jgi:hypothetical protein